MQASVRILILEDNPSDLRLLVAELKRSGLAFSYHHVDREEDFVQALSDRPDVILSDYSLSGYDGLRALERWKELEMDAGFIIISGTVGEEFAVEAMKAGATDYLLKDKLYRLGPAVKKSLEMTQLKREKRVITRLAHLRDRAIECLSQGVMILEGAASGYGVLYVNQAWCHISGYAPAEFLGRSWSTIESLMFGPSPQSSFQPSLEAGRSTFAERQGLGRNGKKYWCTLTLSPIHDPQGHLSQFVIVLTDTSDAKQLELKFLQAQKLEAIGRLAGGIAHDFNNLLTIILGYSQFLIQKEPAEIRTSLTEIHKAAERASSLTQQLLVFSRREPASTRPVDLNAIVGDSLKILARVVGADIQLKTNLAGDLGTFLGDAGQIQQVLMNLIVNARDAMPHGGMLSLRTYRSQLDNPPERNLTSSVFSKGRFCVLEVTDNGTGISEDVRKHLFEPFFTTKEPGRGTGLGLATVYGIVERHHGMIEVDSTLGVGTTFRLSFPGAEASPPAAKPVLTLHEAPAAEGMETIFVVEDEDQVRSFAKICLESYGYNVLEAKNGPEALYLAHRFGGPIDLLLIDVIMPRMSGRELAEFVRRFRPDAKVLFTTGHSEDAFGTDVLNMEKDRILLKPYTPTKLVQKIREILDS